MARGNIPPPPSSITGELGNWLREVVWDRLANTPSFSYFSGLTPNSNVTGLSGDVLVNVGSASTDTRIWVKGGSPTTPTKTGWVAVRTLA